MAEENKETNSLDDLSKLKVDDKEEVVVNEPKIDILGRSYATGRRKESTARVWVKRGTGKITINGKEYQTDHFKLTSKDMTLPDDKRLNFDIWLDKKTSLIVKVTYQRMGSWEYRLKNYE